MKKILKYNEPEIETYLGHACSLAIIMQYEKGREWFLQNYINIIGIYNEETNELSLDFMNLSEIYFTSQEIYQSSNVLCPPLNTYSYPKNLVDSNNIISFIKMAIDNNFYICLFLNRKYLTNINSDVMHDAFIYGYDDEQKIVFIGEYTNGRRFGNIKCKYDEVLKAYKYTENKLIDSHDHFIANTNVNKINLLCYNENYDCKFDKELLINKMKFYLHPEQKVEYYKLYIQPENQKYFLEKSFGIQIYEYLYKYIKIQITKCKSIDYRIFHLWYEHKTMYSKRINFLRDNDFFINDDLQSLCNNIERDALILRNIILKYEIENQNNMNNYKRKDYLNKIEKYLSILFEVEKKVITDLITLLEM